MSNFKLTIHADDIGLTENISKKILDTYDNGVLNSTSIIATGAAFNYASAEVRKRKKLNLALHLNLIEGRPLLDSDKIKMLINGDGHFCLSFQSLMLKYYFSSSAKRLLLEDQIQSEIIAQIEKLKKTFGDDIDIKIDSHQHLHMIPFIFRIILNLKKKYNITFIRIPYEPFFIGNSYGVFMTIKNYLGLNLVKHLLLNYLSLKNRKLLSGTDICCNDYTVGVLFSGNMSSGVVKSALKKILKTNNREKAVHVELLFHPGGESDSEALRAESGVEFFDFYCSPLREYEAMLLKDSSFKNLIKEHS